MYLRRKDKILLAILTLLFSIGFVVGGLIIGQTVLLFSQAVLFFSFFALVIVFNDLKQLRESFKQVESLFYLFSTLKFRHPLPSMRGWAISPDFANTVISLIREHKPKLVVEAGSGISTLITAYCLQEIGHGNVISLDHDKRFAEKTDKNIIKHQLQDRATIIYAPMQEFTLQEKPWLWYDTKALLNLKPIDMLIVDGPPSTLQKLSRYPALPILFHLLSDDAIILLDDASRSDERKIVELWLKEFPNFSMEKIDAEKGAVVLRRHMTEL